MFFCHIHNVTLNVAKVSNYEVNTWKSKVPVKLKIS